MAQTVEYPMFSPNTKAKFYKRYTGDIPFELKDNETITIQRNRYVYVGTFRWIETTTKQDADEQPLDGLIVPNAYITIKTNSLKEFHDGDVVELPKDSPLAGLWLIMDGKTADYIYTPKPVQTYQYLPLSSAGLN